MPADDKRSMRPRPRLEIDLDPMGRGTVLLDGQPLPCVRAITLRMEAGEISRVDMELVGVDTSAKLEDAEVTIERVTHHARVEDDPDG